jgi:hypothetical protein
MLPGDLCGSPRSADDCFQGIAHLRIAHYFVLSLTFQFLLCLLVRFWVEFVSVQSQALDYSNDLSDSRVSLVLTATWQHIPIHEFNRGRKWESRIYFDSIQITCLIETNSVPARAVSASLSFIAVSTISTHFEKIAQSS